MRDSPASHERQRIGPEENGRIERRREIEASRDPLTGLANREFFLRRVQGVIGANDGRCPQELAVLVIGLDRFKVVNGSLGHRSGDDFLRLLAGRIAGCSRPGDLVARLGGDEFAILLDAAAGRFDAPGVGSRILEELSAPIQLAGRTLYPAASIGIAFGSSSRGSAAELIRDAGTALHRAKEAGRDRVAIFDRSMHRAAVERLEVESDLRRAIDRDELWLAYQPIVSVAGGRVEALEVL